MTEDYVDNIQHDVKLHLQEADDIKKQWFNYVYASIERLSARVEATSLKVERERVEVLERLNELREMLSKDIKEVASDQLKQLEKVETRVERLISEMSIKVDAVNASDIKLQLDVYVQESEDKMDKSLNDFAAKTNAKIRELDLAQQALKDTQTELKTKIKSYAFIAGLITTAVATVFSSIIGGTLLKVLGTIVL